MLEIRYTEGIWSTVAEVEGCSHFASWAAQPFTDRGPVYRDYDQRPICVGMTRHAFEVWCESFFHALTRQQRAAADERARVLLANSVAEIGTHAQLRERYVTLHSS